MDFANWNKSGERRWLFDVVSAVQLWKLAKSRFKRNDQQNLYVKQSKPFALVTHKMITGSYN